jgi:hypothetical protein
MSSRSNGKRQFLIIPLEILANGCGSNPGTPYLPTTALLATWQHLYRQLHLWHQEHYGPAHRSKSVPYHWLMDTSAHGYENVNAISCASLREALTLNLCSAFKRLTFFKDEMMREFASYLGFTSLEVPMRITARQPSAIPTWIKHCYGIKLQKSPNEYHPGAIWTHGASLQIQGYTRRNPYWALKIEYSYREEDSSWGLKWHQKPGETLESMLARAKEEFFSRVDWGKRHPCPDSLRRMTSEYTTRSNLKHALSTVFCDNGYRLIGWEYPLMDLCLDQSHMGVNAHRIDITPARLRTLKSWAQETLKDRPKTTR